MASRMVASDGFWTAAAAAAAAACLIKEIFSLRFN